MTRQMSSDPHNWRVTARVKAHALTVMYWGMTRADAMAMAEMLNRQGGDVAYAASEIPEPDTDDGSSDDSPHHERADEGRGAFMFALIASLIVLSILGGAALAALH